MYNISFKLTNTDKEYSVLFDDIEKTRKILKGKKEDKWYKLADLFNNGSQALTTSKSTFYNNVNITDDFKKLAGVPTEITTNEGWTLEIRFI